MEAVRNELQVKDGDLTLSAILFQGIYTRVVAGLPSRAYISAYR
jgi:hypothetical protein